nr:MAG TPA: hypothetical protein [Caudoviricetes sp.]
MFNPIFIWVSLVAGNPRLAFVGIKNNYYSIFIFAFLQPVLTQYTKIIILSIAFLNIF